MPNMPFKIIIDVHRKYVALEDIVKMIIANHVSRSKEHFPL